MSWRTVVIDSLCKLSYKNGFLLVKGETENKSVHLSEINLLMVASTQVTVTAVLLVELAKRKIKVVFCDEFHNPYGELSAFYGSHNSAKKIEMQIAWDKDLKNYVADKLIKQKINNQAMLLKKRGFQTESDMLIRYIGEFQPLDSTNREGHAAKVFFNALFGKSFTREIASDINAKLDYGYAVVLSAVNRDVVSTGCITQLGLRHHNEFNGFNLSCDLMEPWRIIVDEYVYDNLDKPFDVQFKHELVNLMNKQVRLDNEYYLCNAIGLSVRSAIDALNQNDIEILQSYCYL